MTRQSMVVLVVDQDPEPRQLVAGWLRNAGYPCADLSGGRSRRGYTCAGGRGELCPLWKPLRRR
jgi:CheY-like chemotaxis protein